jgi:hypothetical protein
MQTSDSDYLRGHPIHHDGEQWRYTNTGAPTATAEERPCGHCGGLRTAEGHDACLGTLPDVLNACCGHGQERAAYIVFSDGRRLAGSDALNWAHKANR